VRPVTLQRRGVTLRIGPIKMRHNAESAGGYSQNDDKNERDLELPPRRLSVVAADETSIVSMVKMIRDRHAATPL
jgi:hypothetical protein